MKYGIVTLSGPMCVLWFVARQYLGARAAKMSVFHSFVAGLRSLFVVWPVGECVPPVCVCVRVGEKEREDKMVTFRGDVQ